VTWPDFWGSCRFFKRYPKILGGSKTPVNISYCGQALARLLQDDYKDLGHDNEEKVNPLSTFAQQFLCVFFSKYFHLYFNSLLAHARKKQRKKGVQTIWCCFFSTSLETNMASAGKTASETSSCDCLQFALSTSDTDLGVSYHRRMRV
jgi:hypothetical protein